MGKRGKGYGSEYHLRSLLADPVRRQILDRAILEAAGMTGAAVRWLEFPKTKAGDRELTGMEFLTDRVAIAQWKEFWPQWGRQPSWDAVGQLVGGAECAWTLVEAKANWPEFCSAPCGATGAKSLEMIEHAIGRTKKHLGVFRRFPWLGTYYQYANRLACLYFLREVIEVPAHLVFLYFIGDQFPDGTPCPSSIQEWHSLIEAAHLTIGLPSRHPLSPYVHDVFISLASPSRPSQ
jgi:hypothetical protein